MPSPPTDVSNRAASAGVAASHTVSDAVEGEGAADADHLDPSSAARGRTADGQRPDCPPSGGPPAHYQPTSTGSRSGSACGSYPSSYSGSGRPSRPRCRGGAGAGRATAAATSSRRRAAPSSPARAPCARSSRRRTPRPRGRGRTSSSSGRRRARTRTNTQIMISAAEVITRAVAARPSMTALSLSSPVAGTPRGCVRAGTPRSPSTGRTGWRTSSSARSDTIGTVSRRRQMPFTQPHWNTATITPYAAPTDSRFMTAALSGTRIERNTIISSRNDSTITAPMNHGSRAAIWSEMSMNVAVDRRRRPATPVRRRSPRGARRCAAAGPARDVAASCGDAVGDDRGSARRCRPALGIARARRACDVRGRRRSRRSSRCQRRRPSSRRRARPTSSSGPLEPGPEALGEQVVGLARWSTSVGVVPSSVCPSRRLSSGAASVSSDRRTPATRSATGGATTWRPQRCPVGSRSVGRGSRRARCACPGGRRGRSCARRSRAARAAA